MAAAVFAAAAALVLASSLPFPLARASDSCSWRLTVVAPEVAVPARPFPVLLTLKRLDARRSADSANVTLRLVRTGDDHDDDDGDEGGGGSSDQPIFETSVFIQDHGVIPFLVPREVSGTVSLEAVLEDEPHIRTTSIVRIVSVVRDVIIRPMSKFYKPGETVEFWILAVDHDLMPTTDCRGKVFMADPRGSKVAVWEEILLDQGVQKFSVPLSPWASSGEWTLGVRTHDGSTFTCSLNVSATRGSRDPLTPDLVIAEEHFVELRFAPEMRRRYKPGLPFVGKVEAMSSERAVRVRVKVLDGGTAIYSQDIEMAHGEGAFSVPAILSDSDVITLQAELVSVAGKETDSHYVLAREPILKWNSTSTCYLLIEGMQRTLQPSDVANATILSSCPCDHDLHFVITTEGHVTYWSQSEASTDNGQSPPSIAVDGAAICKVNFSFSVQAIMAPVSHLLVYYVTRAGEPISDVITFDVRLLDKKAGVSVERNREWTTGETVKVAVDAEPGSTVCLVGGRGGELQESRQTESVDFSQAELSLSQLDCGGSGNGEGGPRSRSIRPRAVPAEPHRSPMLHAGLEQLWLWHCYNYTSEVESAVVSVAAPSLPGKWTLFALLVSPRLGLRFSAPAASLSVVRRLDVDFSLAPSIVVGETLEVDVKITNNVDSCVDVNALLSVGEGAQFAGGTNQPYVAEKLRLGPRGATSLVVRLRATQPGSNNMTVEVTAYVSDTCQTVRDGGGSFGGSGNGNGVNRSLVGSVVRTAPIDIRPEGLVRTRTDSAYFCANEKMVVSEVESFRFEWVPAPRNREGVVFEVRASGGGGGGVHVALSDRQVPNARMYRLVLGDLENTVSYVTRGDTQGSGVHLVSAETPDLLSAHRPRSLWVSWERGVISCGRGSVLHANTVLQWTMDKNTRVAFIGFATTWRQKADFRIWNYNEEAGFSQVLHLDMPRSVLPSSESGQLIVDGGLYLRFDHTTAAHAQTARADSSLSGVVCRLAPLVLDTSVGGNASDARLHALSTLIQDLLAHRRPQDGSFGDHRDVPNYWGTLQSLYVLSKAQSWLGVDPDLLAAARAWVRGRQARDGGLSPSPTITPDSDLDDGVSPSQELNRRVQATAEALDTFLSIGVESTEDNDFVLKARYFLERNVYRVNGDGCTLATLCAALVASRSELWRIAVDRVRNASTNDEGDFGWPRPPLNTDWLYEEGGGGGGGNGDSHQQTTNTATVSDYKASLYALSAYSQLQDLKSAEQVAKYLFYRSYVLDKHSELVLPALVAFGRFSLLAADPHRSLTLSLATSGMELTDTVELRPDSPLQRLPLPSLPTKVFVYATGAGCATVQGRVRYATYSPGRSSEVLDLSAAVEQEILPATQGIGTGTGTDGRLPILDIRLCLRWKGGGSVDDWSDVVHGELRLFSGFRLASVRPPADDGAATHRMWHDADADTVRFSMLDVSATCWTCARLTVRSEWSVRGLRPALARAYPAARPDLAAETFFTSPLLTDSEEDYISWFNTHSGSEGKLSDSGECGTETASSASATGDELNDDLVLSDVIILSDLDGDANATMSPDTATREEESTPGNTPETVSMEEDSVGTETTTSRPLITESSSVGGEAIDKLKLTESKALRKSKNSSSKGEMHNRPKALRKSKPSLSEGEIYDKPKFAESKVSRKVNKSNDKFNKEAVLTVQKSGNSTSSVAKKGPPVANGVTSTLSVNMIAQTMNHITAADEAVTLTKGEVNRKPLPGKGHTSENVTVTDRNLLSGVMRDVSKSPDQSSERAKG